MSNMPHRVCSSRLLSRPSRRLCCRQPLLYYEEGNPAASVDPDVFVVVGVPKYPRRIYKLWDEGQSVAVVIKVTSRSAYLDDLGTKHVL